MKRLLLLIFLMPASLLLSQQLELFGYYEPQWMGVSINDHFYNVASNKLRLDIGKQFTHVEFGANVNYVTYHGKTEWHLADYLPTHISNRIPDMLQDFLVFHFGDMAQWVGPVPMPRPDRIYLDNAFVKIGLKKLDITIGKQQLGMGTGYTWNPTDLFNVKDFLDPTYEQPGHNAVRLEMPVLPNLSLDSYFAPGEEFKNSNAMLKLKTRIGRFDLSAVAVRNAWLRTEYSNISLLTDPLNAVNTYHRHLVGGDFVGELFGLGVWGEGGYTFVDLKTGAGIENLENYWQAVLGLDYTFDSGLYIMAEYYHDSLLPGKWQDYSLNHWMWYLTAETKALCRDNLFALAQYPDDLVTPALMIIHSISDGSAAIVPTLYWTPFQEVELTAYLNLYTGEDGRAYAKNLGNGGLIRLRVYF